MSINPYLLFFLHLGCLGDLREIQLWRVLKRGIHCGGLSQPVSSTTERFSMLVKRYFDQCPHVLANPVIFHVRDPITEDVTRF